MIDDDRCVDCNMQFPHMHNSREVTTGWWLWKKTITKRFPGYTCFECWKKANPILWKPRT